MSNSLHDLPPKAQVLFYRGYQQALMDLADQCTERAGTLQARIDRLLALARAEDSRPDGEGAATGDIA